MKSLLDYTDEELNLWITRVRQERDDIRNGKIQTSQKIKKEKIEKVEKKAREKGIEVLDTKGAFGDIMKAFLKG